jgi:hypothetical protein
MTFLRWLPTFLAFPLAGLITIESVGSLDGPASAAAAGLLAGAVIGTGQWLALRSRGVGPRWIAYTAAAMAAGTTIAAVANGTGTALPDVMLAGLIVGATVGGAQSVLLTHDRGSAATWTAVTAIAWALGWLATWATIVDIERGYVVFGSSGALIVTVLTGLALRRAPLGA